MFQITIKCFFSHDKCGYFLSLWHSSSFVLYISLISVSEKCILKHLCVSKEHLCLWDKTVTVVGHK